MDITKVSHSEWNDLLPKTGSDPFHMIEALEVLDRYADGELRLFVGFRGDHPVGLVPLFVREEGFLTFVMSPPPGLSIPRLGPIIMAPSPKRHKQQRTNQRFTDGVLEAVGTNDLLTAFGTVTTPAYTDPRPYLWSNLRVDTRFTYVLDLEDRGSDDVLDSFSGEIRREIGKRDEIGVEINREGPNTAGRVCGDMKERHAEQGLTYPTPTAFSRDLVDALDDRARVYVARAPDGTYLSGMTILYSNDEAIFWQGGAKASYENVSVNSLLHWQIIEDILEESVLESVERYDLGNAAVERIAGYKSKFDAELVPHYEIKSDLMLLAKKAYSTQRHLRGIEMADIEREVRDNVLANHRQKIPINRLTGQ